MSGTLYIPSLIQEKNIFDTYQRKLKKNLKLSINVIIDNSQITTQSNADLRNIADNSIDYIFTDPPFGDSHVFRINYM